MLWIYLILITLLIFILSGAIPFIQFILLKRKESINYRYTFSSELLDYDWNSTENEKTIPREIATTRGWIRGPQGNTMTEQSFQKKRAAEYSIDLP